MRFPHIAILAILLVHEIGESAQQAQTGWKVVGIDPVKGVQTLEGGEVLVEDGGEEVWYFTSAELLQDLPEGVDGECRVDPEYHLQALNRSPSVPNSRPLPWPAAPLSPNLDPCLDLQVETAPSYPPRRLLLCP